MTDVDRICLPTLSHAWGNRGGVARMGTMSHVPNNRCSRHRRRKRGGQGGPGPPNNLRGGANIPFGPPIIHPSVPAKLFLSILSLNFLYYHILR